MFRPWLLTGAFCALSLIPVCAAATTTPSPSDLPTIATVSTADRLSEPILQSARPTTIITRAQIEARGARTLAEALAGVPTLLPRIYGAYGSSAGLSLQGAAGSDQVLVLLDGLPLNLGSTGAVDIGSVPLVGIERIEVLEGGASTLYGSSAVAGVINLITGAPSRPDVDLMLGSFGERTIRAATATHLGSGTLGIAAEDHVATDAYPYPGGTRQNDDAHLELGRLTYDTRIAKNLQLHAIADTSSLAAGVPGGLSYLTPTLRNDNAHNDLGVILTRQRARSQTTLSLSSVAAEYRFYDFASTIDPTQPAGLIAEDTTDDRRVDLSLRDMVGGSSGHALFGIDLSRESANIGLGYSNLYASAPPTTTPTSASQTAAYAQLEHLFNRGGRWYVGMRAENDTPHGTVVVPAAGAKLPLGKLALTLNAGGAYRVPNLEELFYPGASNPSLAPERSRNIDATLTLPTHRGRFSLGLFDRDAHNLIVSAPPNYVPENIGHAGTTGYVATAEHNLGADLTMTATLTENYRALDLGAISGETRLAYVPRSIASIGIERPVGAHRLGFGLIGNAAGASQTSETNPTLIAGWTTFDTYVRLPIASHAIVTVRALNVTNRAYELYDGYPLPGRRYAIELATQ